VKPSQKYKSEKNKIRVYGGTSSKTAYQISISPDHNGGQGRRREK
jgi:hypothetical protein